MTSANTIFLISIPVDDLRFEAIEIIEVPDKRDIRGIAKIHYQREYLITEQALVRGMHKKETERSVKLMRRRIAEDFVKIGKIAEEYLKEVFDIVEVRE